MENVRILIGDLTNACIALCDVHVIAAGSMYATLECDMQMRDILSKAGIHWSFD